MSDDAAEQILREEIRAWLGREDLDLTSAIADGAKKYLEEHVWWMEGRDLVNIVEDAIAEGTRRWMNEHKR